MRFLALAFLILCLLMMTGCAVINEGAIDYRKADYSSGNNNELCLVKKYVRSSDGEFQIVEKDTLSVHLQQLFIKDFTEAIRNPLRKDACVQGEIAVVIKVFELEPGKDIEFSPEAVNSGRLVYYSDDVRKNQFLNFSSLPVYGPIDYKGNPFVIVIHIIEIDASKNYLKRLLQTLVGAGKKVYPPSSPVLSLLDELGGALLKGKESNNDVEFRYHMVLYPQGGHEKLKMPNIEAGDYVFVRKEDRADPVKWENIVLDPNEGRLYTNKNNTQPPNTAGATETSKCQQQDREFEHLYTDETYLTLQINKGMRAIELNLQENIFGNFLKKLEALEEASAEDIEELTSQLVKDRVQLRVFDRVRGLLSDLELLIGKKKEDKERIKRLANEAISTVFESLVKLTEKKKAQDEMEKLKEKKRSHQNELLGAEPKVKQKALDLAKAEEAYSAAKEEGAEGGEEAKKKLEKAKKTYESAEKEFNDAVKALTEAEKGLATTTADLIKAQADLESIELILTTEQVLYLWDKVNGLLSLRNSDVILPSDPLDDAVNADLKKKIIDAISG